MVLGNHQISASSALARRSTAGEKYTGSRHCRLFEHSRKVCLGRDQWWCLLPILTSVYGHVVLHRLSPLRQVNSWCRGKYTIHPSMPFPQMSPSPAEPPAAAWLPLLGGQLRIGLPMIDWVECECSTYSYSNLFYWISGNSTDLLIRNLSVWTPSK